MAFPFPDVFSDPYRDYECMERKSGLLEQFCHVGNFFRTQGTLLRYGELSRAPLSLLRLQVQGELVECDWTTRTADVWDGDLLPSMQQRHLMLQTLRDAIDLRALLFDLLPTAQTARMRAYRAASELESELVLSGATHRNDQSARSIHSLVMRAKILGFHFELEGDALQAL